MLEDAFNFREKYIKSLNDFNDLLDDWVCEYNPRGFTNLDDDVVCVRVYDLKEWLDKYHKSFCETLDLKLIDVQKIINYQFQDKPRYNLKYTYADNLVWCEIECDTIF